MGDIRRRSYSWRSLLVGVVEWTFRLQLVALVALVGKGGVSGGSSCDL